MPIRARLYIALILAAGTDRACPRSWSIFSSADPLQFWCYFVVTILTSGLKVRLPMVFATLSVNFLFILVGIVQFSLPEAIVLGVGGNHRAVPLAAARRGRRRSRSLSAPAPSAWPSWPRTRVFHGPLNGMLGDLHPLLLGARGVRLLHRQYGSGRRRHRADRAQVHLQDLVSDLLLDSAVSPGGGFGGLADRGADTAGLVACGAGAASRWSTSFTARTRCTSTGWRRTRRHVEEIAGLHLRTIEALALAIEAKDTTTADHLQRVRVYATEIGKEIGLSQNELDALQAAALLHDIGKLAVPEHIISKPGRLTPEEFEKMKIHPLVGAEILEEVKFPYPVVPIVRAHHEKWDGSGYPFGLAGEEIPIGARILSVVDCLDALASDRQYRRALPLDQAMEIVISESGKSFDPVIVDILRRRYVELERMARQHGRREGTDQAFDGRESRARPRARHRFRRVGRRRQSPTRRPTDRSAVFHRRGHAGSADAVRADAGSGEFAQPAGSAGVRRRAHEAADSV